MESRQQPLQGFDRLSPSGPLTPYTFPSHAAFSPLARVIKSAIVWFGPVMRVLPTPRSDILEVWGRTPRERQLTGPVQEVHDAVVATSEFRLGRSPLADFYQEIGHPDAEKDAETVTSCYTLEYAV